MTVQRKRKGLSFLYWKSVATTNFYGDKVTRGTDGPYEGKGWVVADRASRAEVPGQQEVNMIKLGVDPDVDVTLWSEIEYDGKRWDVESPPAVRHGTRHVAHQTLNLRLRTVKEADG